MEIRIAENRYALGQSAAKYVSQILRETIAEKGKARMVLSTGASQFDTLEALTKEDVQWDKVEMFHLDEYVDLPETHPASFRKYLKERFVEKVAPLAGVYFVDGTVEGIAGLTQQLRREPIDIGLIGIGENTHIAFNDPPADFDDMGAYKVVNLDEKCRKQQLGEGWFPTFDDVPKQAISMTVHQILECKKIVSAVPYAVKADAIYKLLNTDYTNMVPATALKRHADVKVFIDKDSGALVENVFTV